MKKVLITLLTMILLCVTSIKAQDIPSVTSIRLSVVNADTMQIKVIWTRLPPVYPSTITAYDVILWARPKIPIIEYFQVVTGDTTTYIRVAKTSVPDGTIIYAAVRSAVNPRRGAITYRKP